MNIVLELEIQLAPWARWVAQDLNGEWFQFRVKPRQASEDWDPLSPEYAFVARGVENYDWPLTLRKVE